MISQAWSLLLLSAVCAVRAADIHEAVRSNDMSAIKAALSSGEDINKIGNFCVPFVHLPSSLDTRTYMRARTQRYQRLINCTNHNRSLNCARNARTLLQGLVVRRR